MSIVQYLVPILAGLAAHQTNPIFEDLENHAMVGAAWYRMARYAVGYLLALPSLLLLFVPDQRRQIAERYLSNGVLFGYGVAIGYVLDRKWRKK